MTAARRAALEAPRGRPDARDRGIIRFVGESLRMIEDAESGAATHPPARPGHTSPKPIRALQGQLYRRRGALQAVRARAAMRARTGGACI